MSNELREWGPFLGWALALIMLCFGLIKHVLEKGGKTDNGVKDKELRDELRRDIHRVETRLESEVERLHDLQQKSSQDVAKLSYQFAELRLEIARSQAKDEEDK